MTALVELITAIEQRLNYVDQEHPELNRWDREAWNARQLAYQKIVNDLVAREQAKFREGDPLHLTLAGIRVSCTSGPHGLLRNWLSRARRQIEEQKAGAA